MRFVKQAHEDRTVVDSLEKGIPYGVSVTRESVRGRNWNARRGDLPLPSLVLRESHLAHNIGTMAKWCERKGFALAPHGKTTMCPEIFLRQMEAGAWGMTVATASQATVCLHTGIRRVFIANQLTGAANIGAMASALRDYDGAEIYCLVDSEDGVEHLAAAWKASDAPGPLSVLLEFGRTGWRAGVRDSAAADQLRRAIGRHKDVLEFRGVEAFEGFAASASDVDDFLEWMASAASAYIEGGEPLLFSVGGSAYLGPVAKALTGLSAEWQPLVRSGCYVTHDHGFYADTQRAALASGNPLDVPEFRPALELWAYVQSLPDARTAILTFGKRDCAYDLALPTPIDIPGAKISRLNDQHAFLESAEDLALRVGDMVRVGISHPCTAFDKWRVIPLVDDEYQVIDLYRTYF